MIIGDIVTEVRRLVQDLEEPFRYEDDVLVGFVNQTLKKIAVMRPDLFAFVDEVPTEVGKVIQSAPADSLRVMEVFSVVDGGGVIEVSKRSLDQTYPQWVNDTAGPCINWMRHARNPNKFFIYPKSPVGQSLVIEYSQAPKDYTIEEEVALLPKAYMPVVVDGSVYLAQSIDEEHVNNQRAAMFMQSFMGALNPQSRTLADTNNPNVAVDEGRPVED